MISNLKFFTIFLLCVLISGQPPLPNGADQSFLEPLEPIEGSPATSASQSGGRISRSPSPIACKTLRFRSLTGLCTHQENGSFGEARRVHFSYFNVNSRIMSGFELKSPREISNILSNQEGDVFNSRRLNELLVFFGQFLDHNVVATPLGKESADIRPPIGSSQRFPFLRSARGITAFGRGQRPVNTLPSAIDLVAVYGPNELRNQALRVSNSCKLKTSAGELLPFNTEGFSNAPSNSSEFYFAGDQRANEHPVLTSLHTLFVREHNRLCDSVAPKLSFSPEVMYEVARSINIAQFQKIVFEEFFPAITGRELSPYRGFQEEANPTLSAVFSTAAFRVGHTMIGEMVTEIDAEGRVSKTPLHENFFKPESVRDGIDTYLRGAAQTRAQEVDLMVTDSLRNLLFEGVAEEGEGEGPDLIALNIQRGRDHNIPSFNEIRNEFVGGRVRRFSEITSNTLVQEQLAVAYEFADDVEAWVGLMAEDKMQDSSFGETLFRVWREEFTRLRDGDQFFYLGNKAFPLDIETSLPELIRPIRDPKVKLFKEIIRRNSFVSEDDLSNLGVFFQP